MQKLSLSRTLAYRGHRRHGEPADRLSRAQRCRHPGMEGRRQVHVTFDVIRPCALADSQGWLSEAVCQECTARKLRRETTWCQPIRLQASCQPPSFAITATVPW